jgi:hypothetical protein
MSETNSNVVTVQVTAVDTTGLTKHYLYQNQFGIVDRVKPISKGQPPRGVQPADANGNRIVLWGVLPTARKPKTVAVATDAHAVTTTEAPVEAVAVVADAADGANPFDNVEFTPADSDTVLA